MTRRDFFFMRFGSMAESKAFNRPVATDGATDDRHRAAPGLGSSDSKNKPTDHGEVKGRD